MPGACLLRGDKLPAFRYQCTEPVRLSVRMTSAVSTDLIPGRLAS
jgi:hypothetical protein